MQMRDYVRKDIGALGVKEDTFYVTVEWRYEDDEDCENWRVEVLAPGGVLTDDAGEAEVLGADDGQYYRQMWA